METVCFILKKKLNVRIITTIRFPNVSEFILSIPNVPEDLTECTEVLYRTAYSEGNPCLIHAFRIYPKLIRSIPKSSEVNTEHSECAPSG